MDIDDLFHSPQNNIARFAEMQVHLYRHDVTLQDYFRAVDNEVFAGSRNMPSVAKPAKPRLIWPFIAANRATQSLGSRKIKTDVLFVPTLYFGRKTEVRLLTKTLIGLAQTGAEILCLLSAIAPFKKELDLELEAAGRSKQVTFLDPATSFSPLEGRMRAKAARFRGHAAFEETVQILEPYGLNPTGSLIADFESTARHIEGWERLAPSIEFDAVVARCHWYDLSSPVCRTGIQRGKPVVTFQQGVVDHTLDVPITASKFVAFGESSASVLAESNRRFFNAVGSQEPPVEYVRAGSLFDILLALPDQFSHRSVLLVDSHSVPGDPWGTEEEVRAILQLAEKLLSAGLPLNRLIIRPHPHWSNHDLGTCLELVREHRDRCELSHPVWSLEDDLRRSSVVVGIASGVLTVASASGLPTLFLRREQGFTIRDLECFSPAQTLFPDAAFCEVSRLLTDHEIYLEARKAAMRNASEYYEGGVNATLDSAFFTRLLSDVKNAGQDGSR